jgi:hypothetical protein
MVAILVEGHEAVARTARSIFPLAEKAGDEPTADLLTQRLAVHEQTCLDAAQPVAGVARPSSPSRGPCSAGSRLSAPATRAGRARG